MNRGKGLAMCRVRITTVLSVVLLVLALLPSLAQAQASLEEWDRYPLRPADTSSPRDTLRTFLTVSNDLIAQWQAQGPSLGSSQRVQTLAETLDLSTIANSDSWSEQTILILQLKEVLDRLELPAYEDIPGDDEIAADTVDRWIVPNSSITIARLEAGPQAGRFVFSARTMERIGSSYLQIRHLPAKPGGTPGILEGYLKADNSLRAQTSEIRNRLKGLNTSSPLSTLQDFLESVNRTYRLVMDADSRLRASPPTITKQEAREIEQRAENLLLRAMGALDLSQVPRSYRADVGVEATLLLKEILDRMPLPQIEVVPGSGRVAPARESGRNQPFRWQIPNSRIEIIEITEGERAGEFLFSAATVRQVSDIYEKLADLPYRSSDILGVLQTQYSSPETSDGFYQFYISTPGNLVPGTTLLGQLSDSLPSSFKVLYRGQTLWQWTALALSLLGLAVACYLVFRIVHRVEKGISGPLGYWIAILAPVGIAVLVRLVADFIDRDLNLTGPVLVTVRGISEVIVLFLMAWVVARTFIAVAESIIASPRISQDVVDASLIRILTGVLGTIVAIGIIIAGLQDLGVDAVPLLAGLGVGGLAVALAIRPTLENLIGGLILFTDKPVRVGDYCSFGNMKGTVETIGVRSTQIRGLDRTLISIPNAKFADMEIINWAQCDRMLIDTRIGLRYETTPDQLRYVLVKLREMFHAHPRIDRETVRVRFAGYGTSSLDVAIRVYALTREWNDFHAIREDVLLRTSDIVAEAGTFFAFPSQTLYMGRDDGLDEERGQAAMQEVKAWRRSWKLPFPRLPKERVDKLEGTLDYPPRGSPDAFMAGEETGQMAEPLSTEPEELETEIKQENGKKPDHPNSA